MSELEHAVLPALELRVPSVEERIVEGIVVPWGETTYLVPDPHGERFLPGSLTRSVTERGDRVKLFVGHDHAKPVGRAVGWNCEHELGLWGSFRIRSGPDGDQVLDDVVEGMTDCFSVGFRATRVNRGEDGAREIVEASLHEVSVAPIGAYDGAQVRAVRTPQICPVLPPMPAVNLAPIPPFHR